MKTGKILYIISLLAIAGISASAQAKPRVLVKHKTYKVNGQNMTQIAKSINANGISVGRGITYAANTDYSLSWQFDVSENAGSCAVKSMQVSVDVTYTLPELQNEIADKSTQDQWLAYYKALKVHESGHATLGIQAAEEIEWTLATMVPPAKTCAEVVQNANLMAQQIAEKYHNDNLRYDLVTDHGHNQGAIALAAN